MRAIQGRGFAVVAGEVRTLAQRSASAAKEIKTLIEDSQDKSDQQSLGIEQINGAIAQMDKNTQQNAAMVEQATAASESLNEEARRIAELVSFFRVADGGPARADKTEQKRSKHGEHALY